MSNMKMTRTHDGVSFEWNSFEEFLVDFYRVRDTDPTFFNHAVSVGTGNDGGSFLSLFSSHRPDSMSWLGVPGGWREIIQKTSYGWPDLRKQLEAMMQGIELEIPRLETHTAIRRRKRVRSDHGDVLDMHRVYNGELDKAWELPTRIERMAVNTKRVTLAFDVTANGGVRHDEAMWRAALCTLLTDRLAQLGRVFEVWVIDSTCNPFQDYGAPPNLWSSWCVKASGDPIVMDRLCAMVSVGYMRICGFVAEGCGPWTVSSGFGGALNSGLPASLRERQDGGEAVIRIGECYNRWQVIQEFARAIAEVEEHAEANKHVA